MILTVTLNTALDKQYIIDEMQHGAVMRVLEVNESAGGKGINVSKVASIGGQETCAMGFIAGNAGERFLSLIDEKIEKVFINADGETRTCVNVCDKKTGKSTEFLESGFTVNDQNIEEFITEYKAKLPQANIVTLCGSMPKGLPNDFYKTLIKIANEYGKKVILDTSGEALKVSLSAKPWFVKPNTDEIKQILNVDIKNIDEIVSAAQKIREIGPENVAVSLGKDGVVLVTKDGVYKGSTPEVQVVNTVGCGDSMVAGFAMGKSRGWTVEETVIYALAVSTANALCVGTGKYNIEDFTRVKPMCKVEKIK